MSPSDAISPTSQLDLAEAQAEGRAPAKSFIRDGIARYYFLTPLGRTSCERQIGRYEFQQVAGEQADAIVEEAERTGRASTYINGNRLRVRVLRESAMRRHE